MRRLDSAANSMDPNLSKLQEVVEDREAWRAALHGVKEVDTTEQLSCRHHPHRRATGTVRIMPGYTASLNRLLRIDIIQVCSLTKI